MTLQKGQGRRVAWGPHHQARKGSIAHSTRLLQGEPGRQRRGGRPEVRNRQGRDDRMRRGWNTAAGRATGHAPSGRLDVTELPRREGRAKIPLPAGHLLVLSSL